MNTSTLVKLFRSLLEIDAEILEDAPDYPSKFEQRHCYNRSLQPMFGSNALEYLTNHMQEYVFYEIIDQLNIHAIFFRIKNKTFLLGPYVSEFFDEKRPQTFLIKNDLPISHSPPIRLLYSNSTRWRSSDIYHTLLACIIVTEDGFPEFPYRTLYGFKTDDENTDKEILRPIDYSTVYQRYANENALLSAIESGDTANVEKYFEQMKHLPKEYLESYYRSKAYQSPSAVLRALVRKAAERGGVSVVMIDELTQSQIQLEQANYLKGIPDNSMNDLVRRLTESVAEYQKRTAGCSPAVIKVMDYIYLNYSQKITMEQIAAVSGYSVPHISRIFREETGSTVSDYIAQQRCKKAASLLKSSDLSIGDIGSLVGYSDNNYFTKKFRQYMGTTPGKYRNKH